jgi:hypothetical protein
MNTRCSLKCHVRIEWLWTLPNCATTTGISGQQLNIETKYLEFQEITVVDVRTISAANAFNPLNTQFLLNNM